MKKILFIFLFFISSCSTTKNTTGEFLGRVQGNWRVSTFLSNWLDTAIGETGVDVPVDTPVQIGNDGNFSLGSVPFRFVEIEPTGILAVYAFIHPEGATERFIGIGFNNNLDLRFNSTIANVSSEIQAPQVGDEFLFRQ